jgi:hypothetical protein
MIEMHNPGMSAADICRTNDWKAGMRLTGTEHYSDGDSHTCTIRITAVGEREVLAVCETDDEHESMWSLNHRKWAPAV